MREYDCRYCLSEGLDKKRECIFTEINPNAKEDFFVSVPVLEESQKVARNDKGTIIQGNRYVGADEFVEILGGLSNQKAELSIFEVYLLWFKEVCLTGFGDYVMSSLIKAESTAAEYKGAIGGLDNEDVRFGLLGFFMEYEDLLEAFNIVRDAKKDYERYRYEQMQRESESK